CSGGGIFRERVERGDANHTAVLRLAAERIQENDQTGDAWHHRGQRAEKDRQHFFEKVSPFGARRQILRIIHVRQSLPSLANRPRTVNWIHRNGLEGGRFHNCLRFLIVIFKGS